jgi:glycosyltransferase involved in cell wall biosynthesis
MAPSIPKVSVGMPVYNGAPYIERAIDSLLSQTFGDLELVIVDNASSDDSYERALKYAADPRVRVYRNDTNIGAIGNFVRTLELARGEYFMWAAADDIREPAFIERMLNVLEIDRAAGVSMSAIRVIKPDGSTRSIERFVDKRNPEAMGALKLAFAFGSKGPWDYFVYGLFKRALLREAAMLFTSGGAPDRILLAQLALGCRFRYVDEPLYVRQLHDHSYDQRYPEESYARQLSMGLAGDLMFYREVFSALLRSRIVPAHRKFFAPLVVARFAATRIHGRGGYLLRPLLAKWRQRRRQKQREKQIKQREKQIKQREKKIQAYLARKEIKEQFRLAKKQAHDQKIARRLAKQQRYEDKIKRRLEKMRKQAELDLQ